MEKFKNTMKDIGNRVHLRADEKQLMQTRIREYMAHMPKRRYVPHQSMFALFMQYRFSSVFVALAVMFTSGVGVTYASNDALPGDALYAVKQTRENMTEYLIFDKERRAEYAIERVHTRLQEVERLAAVGKLKGVREEVATQKLTELSERAQTQVAVLEEEKPARAAALRTALTIGLSARAETLATRATAVEDTNNEARERIAMVAERYTAPPAPAMMAASRVAPSEKVPRATAVMAETADMAVMALGVAEELQAHTTEMAVPVPSQSISSETIATLVRVLNKQRAQLKLTYEKSTGKNKEYLSEVLTEISRLQTEITGAIRVGNYGKAENLVEEALRITHKARAGVEVSLDVRPSAPLPRAIEQTQREKFEDMPTEEPGPPSIRGVNEARTLPSINEEQ